MSDQAMPVDGIRLDPAMIVCARHMGPFRARWPEGFAALTILALGFIQGRIDNPTPDAAVLQTSIDAGEIDPATTAFWDEIGEAKLGDRAQELLTARPICERVTRDQLAAMYASSTIARPGECRICGLAKLGAPYSARTSPTQTTSWPHVCFDCVLDRMEPS